MHKFVLFICTLLFLATPSSVNTQQIVPLFAVLIEKSIKKILSRITYLKPRLRATVSYPKIVNSKALLLAGDPDDNAKHLTKIAA